MKKPFISFLALFVVTAGVFVSYALTSPAVNSAEMKNRPEGMMTNPSSSEMSNHSGSKYEKPSDELLRKRLTSSNLEEAIRLLKLAIQSDSNGRYGTRI